MKKKELNERLTKLFTKIKIKINSRFDKETELSLEDINKQFPYYGKAIASLTKIDKVAEEVNLGYREPKIISPSSIRNRNFKLLKAGGGFLVRKKIKLSN